MCWLFYCVYPWNHRPIRIRAKCLKSVNETNLFVYAHQTHTHTHTHEHTWRSLCFGSYRLYYVSIVSNKNKTKDNYINRIDSQVRAESRLICWKCLIIITIDMLDICCAAVHVWHTLLFFPIYNPRNDYIQICGRQCANLRSSHKHTIMQLHYSYILSVDTERQFLMQLQIFLFIFFFHFAFGFCIFNCTLC